MINNKQKALSRREFIFLMGAIMATHALAIDAILPALSQISAEFSLRNDNDRQYIVTSLFAGYALGVMIYGILSDSFGRKKPVYVGISIFLVGTLVCIFSTSYELLLFGRALQGFGSAAPQIIATAITRDIYKGRGMAQIMSLMMMIFLLVPAIAPLMGQGVLMISNWQGIFVMFLVYTLITLCWFGIRLPETLVIEERVPFSFSQTWLSIQEVFKNSRATLFMIAEGLAFGAILAYLSTAQQIFQEHFGLNERFPLYFGGLALVMIVAAFVNSSLVEKLGMHYLVIRGASLLFVISSIYLIILTVNDHSIPFWSFMIYAACSYFCLGLLFGNMHSLAMEEVGHVAGAAASLIGSVSTIIATIIAAIAGSYYNDSITPIVLCFSVLMLPIIYITWYDEKNGRDKATDSP